jgi:hypothetical protein
VVQASCLLTEKVFVEQASCLFWQNQTLVLLSFFCGTGILPVLAESNIGVAVNLTS